MMRALKLASVLLLGPFACVAFLSSVTDAAEDRCAAGGEQFYCPNCGGINVTDCLAQCDGYLNTDISHGMCYNRKLFNNHDTSGDPDEHYHHLWRDIVGAIVWFLAAGVATACGVGGGGIYVPLGIILLGFAPKPASGLSQASIFGASLGGLILNIRARHPNKQIKDSPCERDADGNVVLPDLDEDEEEDEERELPRHSIRSGRRNYTRPLIDYDMALFLAPMEMAGAVLGTLIQAVMPNWLYLLLASAILSFTSYKTYTKFFAARKKEQAEHQKQLEADEKKKQLREQKSPTDSQESSPDGLTEEGNEAKKEQAKALEVKSGEDDSDKFDDNGAENDKLDETEEVKLRKQYLEEDARQYPREKLLALLFLWIGLIIITFLKGGKGVESLIGITCESPWYAVLIVMQFLWTIGFAMIFAYKLLKRQALKDAVRYPYQPTDVMWDKKKIRFYSAFTFLAGVVAGLIGIGGGMVLGPLMLVMGIHPRVSTATTATMIVLTSSSVAIMFVTSGLVPWSYAVFFFCVCLCGAYLGKKYIDGYVKKTGKASVLIFILATIIFLATMGCLVIVFTGLARNGWCFDGFKKFCYVKTDDGTCAGTRMMTFIEDLYSQ